MSDVLSADEVLAKLNELDRPEAPGQLVPDLWAHDKALRTERDAAVARNAVLERKHECPCGGENEHCEVVTSSSAQVVSAVFLRRAERAEKSLATLRSELERPGFPADVDLVDELVRVCVERDAAFSELDIEADCCFNAQERAERAEKERDALAEKVGMMREALSLAETQLSRANRHLAQTGQGTTDLYRETGQAWSACRAALADDGGRKE